MIPTNELRFVKRKLWLEIRDAPTYTTTNVLQQWWQVPNHTANQDPSLAGKGEWRDVPLVEEWNDK